MGNYVIGVGNYVIAIRSTLGNSVIVHTRRLPGSAAMPGVKSPLIRDGVDSWSPGRNWRLYQ